VRKILLAALILFSGLAYANPPGTFQPLLLLGGTSPPTITLTDTNAALAAANPMSFTGKSFGSTCNNRIISVGTVSENNTGSATVTAVTIGGVSATQIATQDVAQDHAAIWAALVPTGTTGTIAVSFSGTNGLAGIFVYRICDASITPTQTATGSNGNPTSSLTLNVAANGVAMSVVNMRVNSATTYSWTGLAKDADLTADPNDIYAGAASKTFTTTQTGLSISSTGSQSGSRPSVMVGASFPPQ